MRRVLPADIGCRVLAIGERPALRDHPAIQVFGARAADGDDPAVAVGVTRLAGDRPLADVIGQRKGRLLAAAVRLAGGLARLAQLGRVDAIEPDALAVDLERVAVNDRWPPDKVGRAGPGWPAQQDGDGEEGDPTHCWRVSAASRDSVDWRPCASVIGCEMLQQSIDKIDFRRTVRRFGIALAVLLLLVAWGSAQAQKISN